MDQHADDCQNRSSSSSAEPTADSGLVGVCDDCCIDGRLFNSDRVASCTMSTTDAADTSDEHTEDMSAETCEDVLSNVADPDTEQCGLDNMKHDSDPVDGDIASVCVQSSSNDFADVAAAVDDDEQCSDRDKDVSQDAVNGGAVDEPMISATDIYKGLKLVDHWNPVKAQRCRELGGGKVTPGQFTCQAGGSLGLARRLKLTTKLDGHNGCVNALHFNESGKFHSLVCIYQMCQQVDSEEFE